VIDNRNYHLGEIVGAPTAGTNGDIAQISEPTGCSTTFTSRRVTKLDGSRHHLIGVRPTIPASRTIAGVVAGRDEVLEKALAHVRAAK
jgi:C-terminal processing protease CtpA/Prc